MNNKPKSHCKYGHDFSGDNVYIVPSTGQRNCRACLRNRYIGKPEKEKRPYADRFWEQVDKSGDCWLWQGGCNGYGYGQVCVERKRMLAHRYSYSLAYSEVPPKSVVCHKCDNPKCVRPDHLTLATQAYNMQDKALKGRHHNQLKTHCQKGHEYSAENTYMNSNRRYCRECIRIAKAKKSNSLVLD